MENKIVLGVKGVILHQGKVLIIKRADNAHFGGGTWECVGGKLEFGEQLEDALIRETKEEVGLEIEVERMLYTATFKTNPTRQVVILTYLCKCENDSVMLSEEHSEFLWADQDQLKALLPQAIIDDFTKNNVFELVS